jgi:hypothetical protein
LNIHANYGAVVKPGRWIGLLTVAALVGCTTGRAVSEPTRPSVIVSNAQTVPSSGAPRSVSTTPVITATPVDSRNSGWVHTEAGGVIYLAFVEDLSGHLTGNLSITETSDSGTAVVPGSYQLTGGITGSMIAITFNERTWTGTISPGAITFDILQKDGTIAQGRWVRGSIDDYNAAVAQLQTGAISASASSIDAANQQATASSLAAAAAQEQRRVDGIFNVLVADIKSLSDAVAKIPAARAAVDTAVGKVRTAAADPTITTGDCTDADFALSNVDFERSGVAFDISGVDFVTQTIPTDIADLQQQIAALTPVAYSADQVNALAAAPGAITDAFAVLTAANSADEHSTATADSIYNQIAQAEVARCPNDPAA